MADRNATDGFESQFGRNDEEGVVPERNDAFSARVTGTIYGSDEPLQLVLMQLDAGDAPERTWPTRLKSFGHTCLATGRTNPDGTYQLDYPTPAMSLVGLSGNGHVVLQAFAGSNLKWQSPELRWDGDLEIGGVIDRPSPRTYKVDGHITMCGEPAAGYTVSAHAVTEVGHLQPGNACLLGQPTTRFIGNSTLDSNGHYSISYGAPRAPTGSCGFNASVFVEVSQQSGAPLWSSEKVKLRPLISVDHDLLVGCAPESTLIQVVDENDRGVAGAEVVSARDTLGTTNAAGYLAVQGLLDGDQIAARSLLLESETSRQHHSSGSNKNWNFRCYRTSVRLDHNAQGNAVSLATHAVGLGASVQKLRLTSQNALVGFNLVVSVEWDASSQELATYRDRFREASELLYNATEGQFCIERLTILSNARRWDSADVRVYASIQQASNARLRGVRGSSGRIKMNPIDANFPGTLLHELGHYFFGVRDEYQAGPNWDLSNGPPRCTLESGGTSAEFSDGGGKHACVMNGHRGATPKKFCSAHPDNPHVDGTEQGPTDCWTVILEEYGYAGIGLTNPTFWSPRGPVQRQAVVDRLPDSGLALGTVRSAPGARIPGSYIPSVAWKPSWHLSFGETDDRCADLAVRVTKNGLPLGNVGIFLLTAEGRTIFQGLTRVAGARPLQDGTPSVQGELVIRGARVGDRVQAGFPGSNTGVNTAKIIDCGAALEVPLPPLAFSAALDIGFDRTGALVISTVDAHSPSLIRVAVDGADESAMIRLAPLGDKFEGSVQPGPGDQELELDALFTGVEGDFYTARESISAIEVSPWSENVLWSVDGQSKLSLAPGSAPAAGRIAVRRLHQPGPELTDWQLIAGPYHLFATFGTELAEPCWLHLRPGGLVDHASNESSYLLMRLDPRRKTWEAVETTAFRGVPLVVSTPTAQLGTYALFIRACRGLKLPVDEGPADQRWKTE